MQTKQKWDWEFINSIDEKIHVQVRDKIMFWQIYQLSRACRISKSNLKFI